MRLANRPSMAALAISLLVHAGAAMLALSDVVTPVRQRPEPVAIEVTLLAPTPPTPTPPAPAPVVIPAPTPEPPRPRPEPAPRPPPPKPRPAPVARPRPVTPSPTPAPPVRPQEAIVAAAPPMAEAPPVPAPATAPPPAPPPSPPPPVQARTGVSISASYAASNRPPVQPARSLRNNEEGRVVLRVLVQADGTAGEVQVRTSSGFPLLDAAASNAVQSWRFNPATSEGKPVAEWYLVPIIFKLSN